MAMATGAPDATSTELLFLRHFYERDPPVNPCLLTSAELAIAQIEAHLKFRKAHSTVVGDNEHEVAVSPLSGGKGPPSLSQLATGRIVSTLRYDMRDGVRVLAQNCPERLLRGILESPRLHYLVFRTLGKIHNTSTSSQGPETDAWARVRCLAVEDVESWILKNEEFIRRMPPTQQTSMLVTLDDAAEVWPDAEFTPEHITIRRKKPPRENFAFFDELRAREIKIQPSSRGFAETFKRLTGGVFEGLDWANVLVGGGIVLATMMCLSEEDDKTHIESDIDLWIYELNPEDANKKIREIYDVWRKNLDPTKKIFLVKNAKTLTLMSNYPERRIQIILKTTKSAAEVLLNFDLDPCAMCWNGKEVFMLPRSARALETGYTTFNMNLVHGHHLGDRRATQEIRVLKYASRGFGILIPALLMETLTLDFDTLGAGASSIAQSLHDHRHGRSQYGCGQYVYSGKKAAKRIAYLAQDMVHRYYLGMTPMSPIVQEEVGDWSDGDSEGDPPYGAEEWVTGPNGEEPKRKVIRASVSALNGRNQGVGQPGGRQGIGSGFEVLMRLASLFKFEVEGRLIIDKSTLCSTTYNDPNTYDDTPGYTWDSKFRFEMFATAIDENNNRFYRGIQDLVQENLGHNNARGINWKGYLSRRVRRTFHTDNLDDIFRKQITIPVCVPLELEEYIEKTMRDICDDHNMTWSDDEMKVLIPIYNLRDTASPPLPVRRWNCRYWVIGNHTMWAKWEPRLDEIFEVLWVMFYVGNTTDNFALCWNGSPYEDQDIALILAGKFHQRVPASPLVSQGEQTGLGSWPDARERGLFHEWMSCRPPEVSRTYTYEMHHTRYQECQVRKCPDKLWWDEERDGANDAGNWGEWPETEMQNVEARDRKGLDENDRKRKRVDTGLEDMLSQ